MRMFSTADTQEKKWLARKEKLQIKNIPSYQKLILQSTRVHISLAQLCSPLSVFM